MPSVDFLRETIVSTSPRARQVQASFDVPERKTETLSWKFEFPIEQKKWDVGLIVGPSGCGKSSVAREVFGEFSKLSWDGGSVVDDFQKSLSVAEITEACSAVGFNTIPAWLRPYRVLSNGEQFRVELARRLLEEPSPIVVDEFTSLVDRQVARVASHAAQKFARRKGKQLVAVTCHYDVEEWLQPDWVLDVSTREFRWRSLQRRPAIEVDLRRVALETWRIFAPFHYMSADLSKAAKCFALHVDGRPVSFAGILHFPHPKVRDIVRASRGVTLPDWQGLGLGPFLLETLASIYKTVGKRFRVYPAHRAFIRSFDNDRWARVKNAGEFSPKQGDSSSVKGGFGGRPCAVFEYRGKSWANSSDAARLLS